MFSLRHLPFEYNTAVIAKKLSTVFLSLWLVASLVIFLWGVWPQSQDSHKLVVPGFGELKLKWNPDNRIGDISVIELKMATQGDESFSVNSESVRTASYSPPSQRPAASAEKKVNKMIEARMEIPAVELKPQETVSQSFQPGDEVVFYWNVNSRIEGNFQGRIWLYTGNHTFIGDSGDRYPISVQSVELRWRDLLGLSGMTSRYAGMFGLITGILLAWLLWLRARQEQTGNLD